MISPSARSGRQAGHLGQRRVPARALVDRRLAVRRDLAGEVPGVDRRDGALVAGQRVAFHLGPADAPPLRDQVRTAELRDLLIAVPREPARRAAERVGEAVLLAREHRGRDRDLAHVLHAARDDRVRGPAEHCLRGEVHSLLGRAALAVDRHAGNFLRQPGGQPRGPGDVASLRADRVDAPEDDVVDRERIESGPRQQRADHVPAEVGRVRTG